MVKKEKDDSCQVLLEDLDENSITSILTKWKEVTTIRKNLVEIEEMLKTKVKVFMKERKWERYMDDDTNISVSVSTMKRETPDIKQLRVILSESQLAQIMRTTTYEKVSIITPEARARLKNYVNRKKI